MAEFRFDPAVQVQVDVLAQRANEGMLSDDERAESDALIPASVNQIDVVHHYDAEAGQEQHCDGIEEIVIRRAKNVGLTKNGGLGDNNIVYMC